MTTKVDMSNTERWKFKLRVLDDELRQKRLNKELNQYRDVLPIENYDDYEHISKKTLFEFLGIENINEREIVETNELLKKFGYKETKL